MKISLPAFLSLNAGYVDTAGFLALQGLFTAHVTGNFVTLGAALVLGTSGVLAKLLALPVFCVIVVLTRLLSAALTSRGLPMLRIVLIIKLLLLTAAAGLAIRLGPFTDGDGWPALATGMTLVCAMAIQNAIHRIHLSSAPPTTLMTGTTTQIMIDFADLMRKLAPEAKAAARSRLARMSVSVACFAAGCAIGAFLYSVIGVWCFVVPAVLALAALFVPAFEPGAAARA
jgi:uncharacterized membrane protein YoaK (UPF0700 family)